MVILGQACACASIFSVIYEKLLCGMFLPFQVQDISWMIESVNLGIVCISQSSLIAFFQESVS